MQSGEVVLSTDADHPIGTPVEAGETLTFGPRTVVVLRHSSRVAPNAASSCALCRLSAAFEQLGGIRRTASGKATTPSSAG